MSITKTRKVFSLPNGHYAIILNKMEDIGNYGYTLFRTIPVGIFRSLVFD